MNEKVYYSWISCAVCLFSQNHGISTQESRLKHTWSIEWVMQNRTSITDAWTKRSFCCICWPVYTCINWFHCTSCNSSLTVLACVYLYSVFGFTVHHVKQRLRNHLQLHSKQQFLHNLLSSIVVLQPITFLYFHSFILLYLAVCILYYYIVMFSIIHFMYVSIYVLPIFVTL